jgi:Glycosyltransferases involved in cell wall biogenesis
VKRKVICLTPVKNESWILERFLKCTSLWADHIIIADQNSDDGSEEIAKSFQKVIYVKNSASQFNEPERQKLLINEARKISGEKVLVALDADEALTGNFFKFARVGKYVDSTKRNGCKVSMDKPM